MRTPWLFEIPPIQEEEWEVIPRSPIPRKMVRSPVKPSISVSQACSQLGTPETIDRFGHNRDRVEPFHRIQIIRVAQCVVSSQGSRSPIRLLRIIGHTDPSGAAAYNLQLGQRRADRVKQHLYQAIESLKPGLGKQIQLLVETQGEQSPISNEAARNRRVEIFLITCSSLSSQRQTFSTPLMAAAYRQACQVLPTKSGCQQPVRVATTMKDYIEQLRRAERELIRCGHKDAEERLHILSGIYYGTSWSRDFQVEKSPVRNLGFQAFLAKQYNDTHDPQPCIGCGLFLSLRRVSAVAGVDIGHVLIGMNARMRMASRSFSFPVAGATGLEITTWVGDLGGAAARLAMARVKTPKTPAQRFFVGSDYGAPSNLEGDVSAYIVGDSPTATSVVAVRIPTSGSIADALKDYFIDKKGHRDRCRRFLILQGGSFSGSTLTNRSSVQSIMQDKIASFGKIYLTNFVRQKGLPLSTIPASLPHLQNAARDVAKLFIDKLLACDRTGKLS